MAVLERPGKMYARDREVKKRSTYIEHRRSQSHAEAIGRYSTSSQARTPCGSTVRKRGDGIARRRPLGLSEARVAHRYVVWFLQANG